MRHYSHSHECSRCGETFECHAPWERNHDGYPLMVCRREMNDESIVCEDCELDAARAELPPEFRDAPMLAKREGK